MRVLLLSIKAGYGHHSTAKAMMECFEKNGHTCEMLDIFDYISPRLGNYVNDGYLLTARYLPKVYGKAYGAMAKKDEPYDRRSLVAILSKFVSKKLENYVSEFKPDIMIGTHSYAGVCMSLLEDNGITDCPTFGIITDYTVHPFWESTFLDYYVVASELLTPEVQKKGIDKTKVLPFGIPVREQFAGGLSKSEARRQLGVEDKPTVLMMMGSMGFGNIKNHLLNLEECQHDFQVLCVCGNNEKMKETIDSFVWGRKIYTYSFVDNADVMMDAADIIITKPGGLTTSEALAKGLPMITMNPIPGQEDRNLEFLVNTGAAVMVSDTFTLADAINMIYSSPWRMDIIKECVNHMGKPTSTADLCAFAEKAVEQKREETVNR